MGKQPIVTMRKVNGVYIASDVEEVAEKATLHARKITSKARTLKYNPELNIEFQNFLLKNIIKPFFKGIVKGMFNNVR